MGRAQHEHLDRGIVRALRDTDVGGGRHLHVVGAIPERDLGRVGHGEEGDDVLIGTSWPRTVHPGDTSADAPRDNQVDGDPSGRPLSETISIHAGRVRCQK